MPRSLFIAIQSLEEKLRLKNIDIHHTKQELFKIVDIGRQSMKLRIVTRFLSILEVLAQQYEYDNGQTISKIKELINSSLITILSLVSGKLSNSEGVAQIDKYTKEVQELLKEKIENTPFLYELRLMKQFIFDIKNDIKYINEIFNKSLVKQHTKKDFKTIEYYLQRIYDYADFLELTSFSKLIDSIKIFIEKEYNNNKFWEIINDPNIKLSLEYFEYRIAFIQENIQNKDLIIKHLEENLPTKLINRLSENSSDTIQEKQFINDPSMTLTVDEINALMDDQENFETISFETKTEFNDNDLIAIPENVIAMNGKKKLTTPEEDILQDVSIKNRKDNAEYEDILIKLTGKLFSKQELLKELLPKESLVSADADLKELDDITKNLKEMLFERYYIKIGELLGLTLREYIRKEVQNLGRKIRLGIRGENSQILTRESEFIKDTIFVLVRNSINYSLESKSRRRALDKSETAWLLIEFEDSGDQFDIFVRDDGRGLVAEMMNIDDLKQKIKQRNGVLEIDSLDNEYLKVHIQIPMKKIIINALVISIGDTNILLPNRCILNIFNQKELLIALKEEFCIGQVNLAPLLGLEKSAVNVYILCQFGEDKVIFGVEKVLYNIETLVENTDIPLIPCASDIVIIKDGSIGFLINEREIYKQSKHLIEKRTEIMTANTIL